ncbi:reverse transcriptase [Phytophthora megakarya]|uniref:Reverse transcriptase n=1 Tax=Phytophthora megakarya TaxID=4795 RepID=A0A225V4D3_9STRA|nr:reverse transcriptase [Phytophthora megakarya]
MDYCMCESVGGSGSTTSGDLRRLEPGDPTTRGKIDCKAPGLTQLHQRLWIDYVHGRVTICYMLNENGMVSVALQRQCGIEVPSEKEIEDLVTLNRLDEILIVKIKGKIAQISALTTRSKARSGVPMGSDPDSLREEVKYLVGEIRDLTQEDVKSDLRFYCPTTSDAAVDRDKSMRLVIPEMLQQDILYHYHTSLQGGHHGIGRTYDRVRDHFQWRGLYKSVKRYVGECVDCEMGKGRPRIQGDSPGNLQATYSFQNIAMDHIPSLPSSFNGNTELLSFVDRYGIGKACVSRSAQTITETYEECAFFRFGAREVIRHDPSFNKILGQRHRATMNYRPQANRSAERIFQTTARTLKMIWINEIGTNMSNGTPSRSITQEIGSEVKRLST